MKSLLLLLVAIASSTCFAKPAKIPGTDIDEKILELTILEITEPTFTFDEFKEKISYFDYYIGGYPPRFKSDEERDFVYNEWLKVVSEAEAFGKKNPETENAWFILSELYRQGHNMDVKGSAEKARANLVGCLKEFRKSIPCNLSASYLYLSIGEKYLGDAEKSLRILRQEFLPNKNAEVEAGYVLLYIYKKNNKMAKKQIDQFISEFPNSNRVRDFTEIRKGLEGPIKYRTN